MASQIDNDDNVEKLSNLYELGIIDKNGNQIEDQMVELNWTSL